MNYLIEKADKYTLLRVDNTKIDSLIAEELKKMLATSKAEVFSQNGNVLLDLNNVKYIDSSGLSAILLLHNASIEYNGILTLSNVSEHAIKVMKIAQLDKIINLYPTLHEAQEAIYMNELEKELNKDL